MKQIVIGLSIWIALSIATAWLSSNTYEIIMVTDDVVTINRKGELIDFYNTTPKYKYGEKLRVYYNWDWAFRQNNRNIKK